MSLTSSLYTGTSGLTNHGNAMQVIGDNIANVNTVGYKGGRHTFADLLSQSVATQSGTAQVGRGMGLGSVDQVFSQGSFESTGNTTDLAIGGDGFFIVSDPNSDRDFYTRAGNFSFDKNGVLTNPEGFVVQGWQLDDETGDNIGSVTDIILAAFTSPPKQTDQINVITNLDSDSTSESPVLTNSWEYDPTADSTIDGTKFEYQTVVKVFDSLGSTHDISIFYDKKSESDWEYMITSNPEEDKRNLVQGTSAQGVLARGTIEFSESSGTISNFTMQELTGIIGNITTSGVIDDEDTTFTITNYEAFTTDGYDFQLEFDGNNWSFPTPALPAVYNPPTAYAGAVFVGDENFIEIHVDGDTTTVADLRIDFSTPAVATDLIGFDINNPDGVHFQDITNTTYSGDATNENTTLQINNPTALTEDVTGTGIHFNPVTGTWHWSSPSQQNVTGGALNVGSAATYNPATDLTVADVTQMDDVATFNVEFVGGAWEWDTLSEDNVSGENLTALSAITTVQTNVLDTTGTNETIAGIELTYNAGAGTWAFTANQPVGSSVDNASSSASAIAVDLAGGGRVEFTFNANALDTETFTFDLQPVPPEEYQNASISTGAADELQISVNGDATDNAIFAFGGGALANGDTFTFDIDPDVPPATTTNAYAAARLVGDSDKVEIHLDGNTLTDPDFEFTFENSLAAPSGSTDIISSISFDMLGSTAWTSLDTNTNGFYEFTADFLGGERGATEMEIEFDIGTQDDGTGLFINDSLTTTQFARSSSTTFQTGNGFGAGDLENIDVSKDGTITGIFSNGELIPLYRVALADFFNVNGLNKEGGNLFSETRDSGTAITNRPGENGLGDISPNSLELSNVDTADQFVKMITTQSGFDANSKIITTVDEMLSTVIAMKR